MEKLQKSLDLALEWLSGPAVVRNNEPVGERGRAFGYTFWNGAIRGEYCSSEKVWDSFCPVWHTGQAVKAFVMASGLPGKEKYLENARECAGFIMAQQIDSGRDAGLILAFEDHSDKVNTSAILEAVDGLFMLTDVSGEKKYEECALKALSWIASHAWQKDMGKFFDLYQISSGNFIFGVEGAQNRPLLDDAVFLKGWHRCGDPLFLEIASATAETLFQDEKPAGNWIKYIPCSVKNNTLHPRHAYWWGLPMLELFRETGERRYYDLFCRAVEWYRNALRRDGGLFRGTGADFNTASFGHVASGSACAAIMFEKYYEESGDDSVLPLISSAENFCMQMQITNPEDPSLRGAILEKVMPPDGSDRIPFLIRDLGTIFFVQAASLTLQRAAN
ncbi:MAG: hypothetical protein IKA87_03035 [Lentisphaeria bacterium]|nr:hypothetical protein [Lentisphaeria bacterium]